MKYNRIILNILFKLCTIIPTGHLVLNKPRINFTFTLHQQNNHANI